MSGLTDRYVMQTFAWLLLFLLSVQSVFAALTTAREEYPLDGGETLVLDVPVPWQAVFVRRDDEAPPSIFFTPLEGAEFELTLTAYRRASPGTFSSAEIREVVTQAGREALGLAPEQGLRVLPIPGFQSGGYVYELEEEGDQPPEAGTYPRLLQGAAAVRDRVIVFTLLFRTDDAPRQELFRMLQGARLVVPRGGL